MKKPLEDQSSRQQQDDHMSMSSDDTVEFSDVGSGARHRGSRSKRIYIQPPVTVNVFGAGAVSTVGSDTGGPAVATTTTTSTGISGSSDAVVSRLESQIAALSSRVDQLASQLDSVRPQPRLQVDGGLWSTDSIPVSSYPRGPTQQRLAFSKRFESAPKVIVGIFNADVDSGTNFRLNAYASDIDSEGFTVHVNSWGDTILYNCGVSWVAIGNGGE